MLRRLLDLRIHGIYNIAAYLAGCPVYISQGTIVLVVLLVSIVMLFGAIGVVCF